MSGYTTEPRFDADDALGIDAELHADDRLRNGARNGAKHESIVGLLRELTRDGRELMSLEMELAKTEVREKVDVYQRSSLALGIGGGLLLAALLLGAWTANMALTALLSTIMAVEIAVWLAPLLLTITLGAIGWSRVQNGLEAMRHEGLKPTKTIETLKEGKRWAERKVHS